MKLPKDHIIKLIKKSGREFDLQTNFNPSSGRVHASKKNYNRKKLKQQMNKEFTGLTW